VNQAVRVMAQQPALAESERIRHSRLHHKLWKTKRASDEVCVDCGKPAAEWSWSWKSNPDPGDINGHEARCFRCHKVYDGVFEAVAKSNISRKGEKRAGYTVTDKVRESNSRKAKLPATREARRKQAATRERKSDGRWLNTMTREIMVRTSERKTFRNCSQAWWWQYREGLVPKGRPAGALWLIGSVPASIMP
jgi:hypothetical protein